MIPLLLAHDALAGDLDALLAKGEVALLETKPDGRLKQATAIGLVNAPIDTVWAKLTAWGDYEQWMAQVADSTLVEADATSATVDFTIAVVGPNISFREKFTLDPANHVLRGVWVSGALPGSHWEWKLVDAGGSTLVYRTLYTNVVDSNWLVRQVEDENHTLEYGINVATGMVEIRSLKRALGVP